MNFVLLAALVAGLAFAQWDALAAMVNLWSISPMYSYAYTVPAISAYIFWARRDAFAGLTPRPAWLLGGGVLLVWLAMVFGGRLSGVQVIEQLAFLVGLTAAVLLVWGVRHLRAGWAALAYLSLMIPVWDLLTDQLHQPFQLRSAAIGTSILQSIGVPAYLDGTVIAMPNLVIEVARECSGVNYLVAVLALGLPLAYLRVSGFWRRALLILSAVAVAALSNGLRVALIGVLGNAGVTSALHGPLHVLHGLFVAVIGYAVLFAGVYFIGNRVDDAGDAAHRRPTFFSGLRPRDIAIVTSAFWLAAFALRAYRMEPVPLQGGVDVLPAQLGQWHADLFGPAVSAGTEASTWWPGADVSIQRRYSNESGRSVDVVIRYFETQGQNKELASFRSADLHRHARPVSIATSGRTLHVNFVKPFADGRSVALFWYVIDGAAETKPFSAKWRTLWSGIRNRQTNGAVVMLAIAQTDDVSEQRLPGDVQDLAARVQHTLTNGSVGVSGPIVSKAALR
jgi:EpsI family protein